jgi:hypothetical protein
MQTLGLRFVFPFALIFPGPGVEARLLNLEYRESHFSATGVLPIEAPRNCDFLRVTVVPGSCKPKACEKPGFSVENLQGPRKHWRFAYL